MAVLSPCHVITVLCTIHWASWTVSAAGRGAYTSQWAARIHGGREQATEVAARHGFHVHAEIFPDVYHLEHLHVAKRSVDPSHHHHSNLISEPDVRWAEQQTIKRRSKRGFLMPRTVSASRSKHAAGFYKGRVTLNDPMWPQMWYLNRGGGLDMNVQGAWEEGITGKGVVITILDDGLEKDHPDLIQNYDPLASYDVNSHDDDPMPRYDQVDSNRHGTRCAGEVAATANNSLCSVGIAYHSSVGGVRMLDGDVTDAVEARSLSLNPSHIDIYSASWGPDDDGKTVDGPGELATRAFIEGVTRGREGKGSIFVWASGNGGRDHDNCNCDGYTNSIWTLSTSSATETGQVPWYSEACSSTLATTYSSGSSFEHQVVTTDLHHDCTSNHTGTSASAPLAAGICALALEANPSLTWRDMQHIVVATARPANLRAPDWATNGVGRNVSHSFGYGLMDATAMVHLARQWKTVPEQFKCEATPADPQEMERQIPAKSSIRLKLDVTECPRVNYLEHVQARVTLTAHRRGDLQIVLISPAGTRATLLAPRPHDSSKAGFNAWPFMSVHSWGEQPFGSWYLEIHNEGRYFGRAMVHLWVLLLYGSNTPPNFAPTPSPVPAVINNLLGFNPGPPVTKMGLKPNRKPNKPGGSSSGKTAAKSDGRDKSGSSIMGSGGSKLNALPGKNSNEMKKQNSNEMKKQTSGKKTKNKNKSGAGSRKSLTVYVPRTVRPGLIQPRGQTNEEDVGLIYLAPLPDTPPAPAPFAGKQRLLHLTKYPAHPSALESLFSLPNYSNFAVLEASLAKEVESLAGPDDSLAAENGNGGYLLPDVMTPRRDRVDETTRQSKKGVAAGGDKAEFNAWSIVLHGTTTPPMTIDNKPILPPSNPSSSHPNSGGAHSDDDNLQGRLEEVSNDISGGAGTGGSRLSSRTGHTSDTRQETGELIGDTLASQSICLHTTSVCLGLCVLISCLMSLSNRR
uniref:furin n=1 Tax=Cacopsylla melanoneura TaxID=428564 RepID=A0A8D9AFR3_9HEMI